MQRRLCIVVALVAALLVGCSGEVPPDTAGVNPSPPPGTERAVAPTGGPPATPPPTAPAAPSEPPPTPPALPQDPLVGRLTRALARHRVRGTLAVVVLADGGAVRFAQLGDRPLLPASTQKLVVAAAALARLGRDFRYTTTLTATAAPDANGVINGDVVLLGSGDPALVSPDFAVIEPDRPRTPLEQLSGLLKVAGVKRVTGRVIGDPRAFPHEPEARGWPARYFRQLDATRVSGLTVNAGRHLNRNAGGLTATAAADPAFEAASELRRLVRKQGIRVGPAVASRNPPTAGVELARVQSPPLGQILRYMVNESDNHLADAVFRTVGAADQDGTWNGAAQAAQRALAPLGLDWTGVQMADGSGLSRANRLPAAFLAALQERMWRSSLRRQWRPLLAVAGRSGTLESRLTTSVASGRFVGKTGTLRDAVSLVGSVTGPTGAHIAVLGNDLRADGSTQAARAAIDTVARIVAEDVFECRRVKVERKPTKRKARQLERPRTRLVCAALPR